MYLYWKLKIIWCLYIGVKVVDLKHRKWYCGCLDDEIPSDDIVFLLTYFVLSNKDGYMKLWILKIRVGLLILQNISYLF